jgi:deoxyhypusine synthase
MEPAPHEAASAILVPTTGSFGSVEVRGYDFNKGNDLSAVLASYATTGFQATHFSRAVDEINKMLAWRLTDDPVDLSDFTPEEIRDTRCTIFLAYTSNMVSCGLREVIRYLVQHKLVDVLVTSAGGVEEDFIKCHKPTLIGEFSLPGKELRSKGVNRIGNLLVPNDNYVDFESWINPAFDRMLAHQKLTGEVFTPSTMIDWLGREIDNEDSVYYWAHKNNIPVFCPALTDGSIGDMLFMHSYMNPGLVLDLIGDIRRINSLAISAKKSGMLILGGGTPKHHTCNANLFRNGADYSVYVNTGIEHEGSDSGASPDEAVSWGKIKAVATPVKLFAEATLVFPLLVSLTFARVGHR